MSAKNAPKWSGLACSLLAVTLALAVLAAGCPKEDDNPAPLPVPPVEPTPPPPPPAAEDAGLELVASGLAHPVALVSPDDGSGRMFIVDQAGTIRIVAQDGTLLPTPFLDLSSSIVPLSAAYDERGLLSMAFHPDYAVNGWFFVHYSAPLRAFGPAGWDHTSTIARFTVSAGDPDAADPGSKVVILEVDQPQANANGGAMVFDSAGCLLVSFGDGGGAGDVGMGHTLPGNGQDLSNFLGSILRLDVDSGLPYTIPADNPFVCFTGIPYEIFAYGFRNPWRMSFDSMNPGTLYVGDAGQNLWEEVDLVSGGMNYGWNLKEGTHYFDPQNPDVSPAMGSDMGAGGEPLKDPIIEYSSGPSGSGTAVIGGYIYNGAFLSTWKGRYVFGDWSRQAGSPDGSIFVARAPTMMETQTMWIVEEIGFPGRTNSRLGEYVLGFGENAIGDLFILTSDQPGPSGTTGKVYRITADGGDTGGILAADQTVWPPDSVNVPWARSNGPGWIVVHGDDAGAPGAAIGYVALGHGENYAVAVNLTRHVTDGEVLHAMVHVDAGAVGTFEFPGADGPALDGAGQAIVDSFTVTLPAGYILHAMSQNLGAAADSVVVGVARVETAGWVVLHADSGGQPGQFLGSTQVIPGDPVYDLVITSSRALADGEMLHVMLHADNGTAGVFEPMFDPPLFVNGSYVTSMFTVSAP